MELLRRIPDQELIWDLNEEEQQLLNKIRKISDEIDEEEKMFKRWGFK